MLPEAPSSGANDVLSKKTSRSSTSVASNAFKTVGKKLKFTNNISGLQFNPGLVNLGNSCYLNSTLQGVSVHTIDFQALTSHDPHS